MIEINGRVSIPDNEIVIRAIRSQGAGGQNVNKVATAICLFFDIRASSLPASYKERLLHLVDSRITKDGVIVIKAQQHRSQEMNRADALERLQILIRQALVVRKKRKATRPTKASRERRLTAKSKRSQNKALRGKVSE